jgi:type IV pilus assembly protein PilE
MRQQTMNRKQRGVTLLELLTVVVILGVLASIAVSTYRRYLLRAQRSDATTALLRLATQQEKHFIQYGTYVTATANLPLAHSAGGLALSATSANGFYTLAVAPSATGYTATATPIAAKGQNADTDCRTFTITETGAKTSVNSGGTDTSTICYR